MGIVILNRVSKGMNAMVKGISKDEYPFIHPGEWLALFRDTEK